MVELLQIEDMVVLYQKAGRKVAALEGANLTLERGKLHCLIGPSGSGKTTLLDVVAGRTVPDAGRIRIVKEEGEALTQISRRQLPRLMTYMTQNAGPAAFLTGLDLLELTALSQPDREQAEKDLDRYIEMFGVQELLGTQVDHLSGGEKQVMELIRVLTSQQPILIADEPSASLDRAWARLAFTELQAEAKSGRLVIAATHDRGLLPYVDTVVTMSFGRVDSHVTQDEVDLANDAALALASAKQMMNKMLDHNLQMLGHEEE